MWTAERLGVRLVRLLIGLVLYGVSLAMMVRAGLGLGPWDVLHEGLSKLTGLGMGWIVNLMGLVVLALWVPLRQRPGFGTIANVVLVGFAVTGTLAVLPQQTNLAVRILLLVAGVVLTGVATGLYVGAGLGPGPRDGLMTGLAARGMSIAVARTVIELSVLGLGFLAGGTVGIGTVLFALAIGPLAHLFIPRLTVPLAATREESNDHC
ncbi:hypothetical protein [Actinocrispum sp. NPDC049592]|uniref:membrane protein YczE n=1 Tax=Actinocrispum sp. NPDC049592 TaxID=3154835 RepID=UPI0034431038